jgi:hypothetical protein
MNERYTDRRIENALTLTVVIGILLIFFVLLNW